MITDMIESLFEHCVNIGVRDCCFGAGSRSTLLIQACQNAGINQHPFFDERAVAFFALGLAKTTNCPVLIITTSGTAVKNCAPAITEASQSGYPLIMCSADREAIDQQTSANQTINQVHVFNDVIAEVHIDNIQPKSAILPKLDNAFNQMQQHQMPIHINVRLNDPSSEPLLEPKPSKNQVIPTIQHGPSKLPQLTNDQQQHLSTHCPHILCIGQLEPWVNRDSINHIVTHFKGWVIVDGSNHWLKNHPNVLLASDYAVKQLHNLELTGDKPKNSKWNILYMGGAWISKAMTQWLIQCKPSVIHCSELFLPVTKCDSSYRCSYSDIVITGQPLTSKPSIQSLNSQIIHHQATLQAQNIASDVHYMLNVFNQCKDPFDCFISNSLPIRIFDQLAVPYCQSLYVNRGASGIDGNIATIAGLCTTPSNRPLLAIIGDLASMVDLNAWWLLKHSKRPYTIVIINNGGGDIFSILPIAKHYSPFDDHFKCKHDHKLTPVLTAMGLNSSIIHSPKELTVSFNQTIVECMSLDGAKSYQNLINIPIIK